MFLGTEDLCQTLVVGIGVCIEAVLIRNLCGPAEGRDRLRLYFQDLLEERDGFEVEACLGEYLGGFAVLFNRLRSLALLGVEVTQFQPATGVLGVLLDEILVSLTDLLPFSPLHEILNLLDHGSDLFLMVPSCVSLFTRPSNASR